MRARRESITQQSDHQQIIQILQKKDKSAKDLENLYNKICMINGFNMFIQNYFNGSDVQEQMKLCGDLQYEKKNKGDIIFEQEELSNNKLYIILKGSCHLFLLKDLDFEDTALQNTANATQGNEKKVNHISFSIIERMRLIGKKYLHQPSLDFDEKNLTHQEIEEFKKRYGKTTRLLPQGSIFGERAIITSQPRTATIIADSHPTELIILERDKFLPALEELKRTLQLRRDILFQIFKDMDNYSSARLESMLYSFQVLNFQRGQNVTQQDDCDDKFYVIAEGEAQILKKLKIEIQKNVFQDKVARLSIIGPGVMVGDEIMIQNDQKYFYTTEIVSIKASVLMADKKIIDRKFPKDLKDYLKKLTLSKERGRKLLLESKIVELHKEIISQLQKDQEKVIQIANSKKGKHDEEQALSMRKLKDTFASKYTLSETPQLSSPKSVSFSYNNNNNNNNNNNKSNYNNNNRESSKLFQTAENISSYQPPSFHLLPTIQKMTEEGKLLDQMNHEKMSNRIRGTFDIKNTVFDFGDGKNIENAERIDKIFKVKSQTAKIHYSMCSPSQNSEFYGDKQQQIIKKRVQRKNLSSMTDSNYKNCIIKLTSPDHTYFKESLQPNYFSFYEKLTPQLENKKTEVEGDSSTIITSHHLNEQTRLVSSLNLDQKVSTQSVNHLLASTDSFIPMKFKKLSFNDEMVGNNANNYSSSSMDNSTSQQQQSESKQILKTNQINENQKKHIESEQSIPLSKFTPSPYTHIKPQSFSSGNLLQTIQQGSNRRFQKEPSLSQLKSDFPFGLNTQIQPRNTPSQHSITELITQSSKEIEKKKKKNEQENISKRNEIVLEQDFKKKWKMIEIKCWNSSEIEKVFKQNGEERQKQQKLFAKNITKEYSTARIPFNSIQGGVPKTNKVFLMNLMYKQLNTESVTDYQVKNNDNEFGEYSQKNNNFLDQFFHIKNFKKIKEQLNNI